MSAINALPGVDTLRPVVQPQQQTDVVQRPQPAIPPPASSSGAEKLRDEKRKQRERRAQKQTVDDERRSGPSRRALLDSEAEDDTPRPQIDVRV